MNIKEVEKQLSVSRSIIRFYEKEGLLKPERKENNYRDYSEQDIAALKKILVLRKLGFTVEEISSMQKGELSLSDAAYENISRLEKEIDNLKGALELTKTLSTETTSFETMDQDRLWDDITQSEQNGQEFADIFKDYLSFEMMILDNMWKYVFFHNFKKSRKKYGVPFACGTILLICVLRGLSNVFFRNESFWDGFLYPIILFAAASIILLPIFVLAKKAPKAASVVSTILLILDFSFLAFVAFLLIYGLIRSVFCG